MAKNTVVIHPDDSPTNISALPPGTIFYFKNSPFVKGGNVYIKIDKDDRFVNLRTGFAYSKSNAPAEIAVMKPGDVVTLRVEE